MKSDHSSLLYSSLLFSFSLSPNFQIYYKVFESKKWKYFKYMAIKSIWPHTSLTKLFQPKWGSKSLRLKGSMVSFHKCWLSNLLNYCRLCKSLISTKKIINYYICTFMLSIDSILGAALIVCGLYMVLWGKSKEMKIINQPEPSKSSQESHSQLSETATATTINNNNSGNNGSITSRGV